MTADIDPGSLRVLGVAAYEERVYQALVGRPSATLAELRDELAADPAQLVRSLSLLEDRGLVGRSADHADRYVAASPAVAIGALLNQHRASLREVEVTLSGLTERYRRAVGARSVGDLIEVVTGTEAIRYRLDQVQRAARAEVMSFVLPRPEPMEGPLRPAPAGRPPYTAADEAVGRGVRYRVVLAREVLERPGAIGQVRAAVEAGEQIRVVDRLPLRMIVADGMVALVPLAAAEGDDEAGAVLVHPSGVLSALVALFEAVWAGALPLRALGPDPDEAAEFAADPDPGDGVDELDGRILSLLLVGLTDRAIASQLGLSMRTVQRRVRHLMDVAGVQTRLQLGWYAARHDWL